MDLAQLFPSTWELLLPNFNIFTVIGVILMIVGGLLIYFALKSKVILGIGNPKIGIITFLVGVVLVWGISIFEDFVSSTGGALIFWGTVAVIVIGVILFWQPKQKNNNQQKLF